VSEVAGRYGASAERETADADEAYGDEDPPRTVTIGLHW
jgi:hypothetical protein